MRVAGLDNDNDWRFGFGKAMYKTKSEMVQQNLFTRIKSFAGDWFLDTSANIDWLTILGNRNNEKIILRELSRVILSTEGVAIIDELEVVEVLENRNVKIRLKYTDIYSETYDELIKIP
tara:strand:+ start:2154 stop:2510 length:357 start_codon:yes stop_codon:yes gene_type:complete